MIFNCVFEKVEQEGEDKVVYVTVNGASNFVTVMTMFRKERSI